MKLYATVTGQKYQDGIFVPVEKSQGSNNDMRIIVRDEHGEWFLQLYISCDDGLIVADAEIGDGEVKRLVEKQIKGEKKKDDDDTRTDFMRELDQHKVERMRYR